ncbi:hypothetical protein COCVIDRAFT_110148 [Bipolaris victoriae FI3]|uniref:Uncharacterized protein n=1 Tax=Bipolaris victoriae (strain FI3) TaxID=930091 RepID=W7E3X0_BIPV3|nr:hypothetical protein COCVIDRAFT_110148 [Bipolaris victoriae FI3]
MPDTTTTPENCNRCMSPKSGSDSEGASPDMYFESDFSSISVSSGDATDSDYNGDDEDDDGSDDEGTDEGAHQSDEEMLSDNSNYVPALRLRNLFTVRSNPASVAKLRNAPVAVSLYDIAAPSLTVSLANCS